MRIAITGGAGYIGSRVTAYLLAKGWTVTVLDSLVYGAEALLPYKDHPDFRLIVGDVRDPAQVASAFEASDAVLHLAAMVGEEACKIDPQLTWQVNRDAALSAVAIARAAGIRRFIFVSTCSNYGVSDPALLADEDSPLTPLSLYAETKVEVETSLSLDSPNSMHTMILRFGTICGVSARMRFDLLVNELARAAVLRRPIELYKPDAWRPFLHVLDAARAVEHVLRTDTLSTRHRVFNVIGENCRKRDLAEMVRKHFADATINVTDAAPDNRDYRVSGDRIARELGFRTTLSVEDAFLETAAAVRDGVFADPDWPGHSAIPLRSFCPVATHG